MINRMTTLAQPVAIGGSGGLPLESVACELER
jgi:hypothetical protein